MQIDKWFWFAVLFFAAWMTGCDGTLSPQGRQLLLGGYETYKLGDDQATISRMDRFLQEHRRSRRADEAYYLRGLAKFRMKDRAGARSDLAAALGRTRHRQLRAKAAVALGDIAYEDNDTPTAEKMYRKALENIDQGAKPADHAHYRLGCVLQRQGRWKEADLHFDRVIYLFKESDLHRLADKRARCSAWTIQVAAFRDKTRAEALTAELRSRKLPAVTKHDLDEAGLLHIVGIGSYPTYKQAVDALANTKGLDRDAFVAPTKR